jgi:hypothetical protein
MKPQNIGIAKRNRAIWRKIGNPMIDKNGKITIRAVKFHDARELAREQGIRTTIQAFETKLMDREIIPVEDIAGHHIITEKEFEIIKKRLLK